VSSSADVAVKFAAVSGTVLIAAFAGCLVDVLSPEQVIDHVVRLVGSDIFTPNLF
jgi:hypothetical protein